MGSADNETRDDSLFGALIAVAADGIIVIDERSIVRVYNAACERIFGYRNDEVVGRSVAMLMPRPYRARHDADVSQYVRSGIKHIIGIGREVVGSRKDGSTFPMYISVSEGRLNSAPIFVGIVHDMSERKARERRVGELQRDLQRSTRTNTMGQLSSAIAHELNQPLAAALNYLNAAQRVLAEMRDEIPDRAFQSVQEAANQIGRAGEIMRRFRKFTEKDRHNISRVDVNQAVLDAISLCFIEQSRTAIQVHTSLASELPKVLAHSAQIEQVLINLLLNAIDAMQGVAEPRLRVETSCNADGIIRVAVVDNGTGLSDEVKRSLYQPFVTTKPDGMGMGLSICRTIVEALGGRLWAEAAAPSGTIFQFTLPVAND